MSISNEAKHSPGISNTLASVNCNFDATRFSMPSRRRSLSPTSGISTASPSVPRIVTKLALDGRSKNTGASVKMYLKLSIPLEAALPGSPVPLFPEESLKIVDSIVHPIDERNVPYAFSNSSLMQASRALNLPTRSSKSYLSLFPHMSPNGVLDERLTGHISIVDFQATYILPKEFPAIYAYQERQSTPSRSQTTFNFVASLEVVLPYRSIPPESPFTLSIPIPRCLQNSIKFHIFPPSRGSWDVSTSPSVAPRPPSSPKSVSSSMSSLISNENDDLSVLGTFPSANEFVLRFAPRDEGDLLPTPSGHKVSVKLVVAQSEWLILDRGNDHLRARLAASFKLKGIWYPGVATLLGLDVLLQGAAGDIEWGDQDKLGWQVHGSLGYNSFSTVIEDNGSTSTQLYLTRLHSASTVTNTPRSDSPLPLGSNSSLLRAPLPQSTDLPDFSFENSSQGTSPLSTPTASIGTTSISASQYPIDPPNGNLRSSQPNNRIVLHIDISDLRLSANSNMECQIYGTLILRAGSDHSITLPSFMFPNAADHKGESLIKSEVAGISLHSERAANPIPLVKGVAHRCPENTMLTILQGHNASSGDLLAAPAHAMVSPEVPTKSEIGPSSQDGKVHDVDFIPEVRIRVTPLHSLPERKGVLCAIHLQMSCPSSVGGPASKLEFGLASGSWTQVPDIQLISSTVGNYSVDAMLLSTADTAGITAKAAVESRAANWVCWVRVPFHQHGPADFRATHGDIRITYLFVSAPDQTVPRWHLRRLSEKQVIPLLPCFSAKIGQLVVEVEDMLGWVNEIETTNLAFRPGSNRAVSYALQPFFFPLLSVRLKPATESIKWSRWMERLLLLFLGALIFASMSWLPMVGILSIPVHPSQLRSHFFKPPGPLSSPPELYYQPIAPAAPPDYEDRHSSTPPQLAAVVGRRSQNVKGQVSRFISEGTNEIEDFDHAPAEVAVTNMPLRARAFAAFAVVRLQRFYNAELAGVADIFKHRILKGWQLCTTIWNWPLPP